MEKVLHLILILMGLLVILMVSSYIYKMPKLGILKTKDSQYIGYISKDYDHVSVFTTPKYPILNCPTIDDKPICKQEWIKIDKNYVVEIEYFPRN